MIKSTDQIIKEGITRPMDDSELNSMKVIDMTGPEQRILAVIMKSEISWFWSLRHRRRGRRE